MKQKNIAMSDVHLSAFCCLHELAPTLTKKENRVTFLFPASDEFYELARRYYDNEPTPINDYVSELKKLKAIMFAQKSDSEEVARS